MPVTDAEFESLYSRYAGPLLSYVRGVVRETSAAEDVVQGVFISALAEPSPTAKPAGWWFRVARNAALNHLRDRRRERATDSAWSPAPGDEDVLPLAGLARSEEIEGVRSALGSLEGEKREAVELHYGHGLTYREIGEVLGIPEGTVKSRCHHALADLRRKLARIAARREP